MSLATFASASAQSDDAERRIAPRMKTLKRAKVLFNNNFSTLDCIVRNISSTGALLTLDEAVPLPKEFDLRVGDERTARPARLVYRRGPFAGIHFVDATSDPGTAPAGDPRDARGAAPFIRRIVPEPLPPALERGFRWR